MTHVAGTGIDYSTWMLQEPSPWAARQPSRSDPESKIGSRVHDSDPDQESPIYNLVSHEEWAHLPSERKNVIHTTDTQKARSTTIA